MLIQRYLCTYWCLYLSQISRRSLQNLCYYRGTIRYYKAHTYTIELILIRRSLHLFGGTRRYYRAITECILVVQNLYTYFRSYMYITEPILVLRNLYLRYRANYCISDTEVPVGTTEHFTGTKVPVGTTELIHYTDVLIGATRLILILVFQILYLSYRAYTYLTDRVLSFRNMYLS